MCGHGHRQRPPVAARLRDDVRIGDAERRELHDRLAVHFAAGRLTGAELEERTTRATAARTAGELRALEADLPRLPRSPRDRRRALLYAHAWHATWAVPTSLSIVL